MSIITEALAQRKLARKLSYDALSRLNMGRFRWNSLICQGSSGIGDSALFFYPIPCMEHASVTMLYKWFLQRSLDKYVDDNRTYHVGSLNGVKRIEQMARNSDQNSLLCFGDVSLTRWSAKLSRWVIADSVWMRTDKLR